MRMAFIYFNWHQNFNTACEYEIILIFYNVHFARLSQMDQKQLIIDLTQKGKKPLEIAGDTHRGVWQACLQDVNYI